MNLSMKPLWRDRNFLVFWSGQALSVLGDGFASVAIPLLVLGITGSVAQMGAITATIGAGRLAGAFVAGYLADRWDRRSLMIGCDLVRAVLWIFISAFFATTKPAIPILHAAAGLSSFAGYIFHVACFSALPSLVGRDQIVAVNSWLWGTYAFMSLVGPMLGGLACARFGPMPGIGVDGLSFLISALSVALVSFNKTETAQSSSPEGLRFDAFWSGLSFIRRTAVLRTMALAFMVVAFVGEARRDLIVYRLEHELHVGANGVGLVLGTASIGAIVAGIFARPAIKYVGSSGTWLWTSSLAGLCVLALGCLDRQLGAYPIAVLLGLTALGESTRTILSQSMRHAVTPDATLGRVTSAYWAIADAPAAIGAYVMARLADRFGISTVFVLAGVALLIATSWAGWELRQMREDLPNIE